MKIDINNMGIYLFTKDQNYKPKLLLIKKSLNKY